MSMLETHYSDGGHGGPFPTVYDAYHHAFLMLKGSQALRPMQRVDIRDGVAGPLVATLRRNAEDHLIFDWAPGQECICGWGAFCGCEPRVTKEDA